MRALARREHSAVVARGAPRARERRRRRIGGTCSSRPSASGLVDDVRFAEQRARRLAERGAGDLLVLDDLARHGIDEPVARQAVAVLEPESERAARIVEGRGR